MNYINEKATVNDYKTGETVTYVPTHLIEKFLNRGWVEGAENGVVKFANEKYVFVNYIRNGIPQHTAESTDPRDLIK